MPGPFKIASCMLECVESRKASREMFWKKSGLYMLVYARNSSFWCNLWQLISASFVSCSFHSICRGSLGANKPYCSAAAGFCS